MRGHAGPFLLLFLLLGLFGGFAWLTQNPETPWLEKAESWPLVGDLASQFRSAYLAPKRQPAPQEPLQLYTYAPPKVEQPLELGIDTAAGSGTRSTAGQSRRPGRQLVSEVVPQPALPTPSGPIHLPQVGVPEMPPLPEPGMTTASVSIVRTVDPPSSPFDGIDYKVEAWIWVLPGNTLRAEAQVESDAIATLSVMSYLPVLGRKGDWAQVMYRDQRAWVDTAWEVPFKRRKAGRGILRHRYEPVRASDSQLLKKAQEILGIDRPSVKLGAYDLYTDVEDEELLGFLDLAAGTAEEAYFARYGRLPAGNPKRSVVLFAKEEDYKSFSPGGLLENRAGHAGRGLLAFYVEGQTRQELARTLVHEIGHLLNDRALAMILPPWLEEGIATDLGSLWVEGSPNKPDRTGPFSWRLVIPGPSTRTLHLAATLEAGKLPSVGVLMSLDRTRFLTSPAYSYSHSAAFVRYLSDSPDLGHGEGFRKFLGRIAAGHGADPRTLLKILDLELEDLDQGFREWLRTEGDLENERLKRRMRRR